MARTPRLPLGLLVLSGLLGLAPAFPSSAQLPAPAGPSSLKTFFTVRSAQPDDSLPAAFREEFEKDDGSPLRSVAYDLDGDGDAEKFFLCGVLTVSGGYQWLVYDPEINVARGTIVGTIIFIGRESDGGYPGLETCWRQGGDMSVVFRYRYGRGRYGRTETRALTLAETSDYFRAKPPLDLDKELVEIK